MTRLAHLSDIHISGPIPDWQWEDWFNKRFTSWINYRLLRRARRFARGAEVLTTLMEDLRTRGIDHVVFSGDATGLGFPSELQRAAELLRVDDPTRAGIAVPGNHDYCTMTAAASGAFERTFDAWQQGRRIGAERYPFAQKVGDVWLVGVNSATGNRLAWDAGGVVGAPQLERLTQLLRQLEGGWKILVTHYPIRLSNGRRESSHHGLRDLDAVLEVARRGGINLWLHGHRHSPYHFATLPDTTFPVICGGTATQDGIWSYGEYTLAGGTLEAVRRVYDPAGKCFRDAERFTLSLAKGS